MKPQGVQRKVLSRVYGRKRGWVFTPGHFLDLGSDVSVRKALQDLVNRGIIQHLARGLYHYPKMHPKLGILAPTPAQIAAALAGRASLRIQASGAYAANLLGLSEQAADKVVFLTDGANRRIQVGNQEIILKQTTPKNVATAGRVSGLVIQALRYLGKDHVDEAVIKTLSSRLRADDRQQLVKDIRFAPAWIAAIFRQLSEREN